MKKFVVLASIGVFVLGYGSGGDEAAGWRPGTAQAPGYAGAISDYKQIANRGLQFRA